MDEKPDIPPEAADAVGADSNNNTGHAHEKHHALARGPGRRGDTHPDPANVHSSIRIHLPPDSSPVVRRLFNILACRIEERSNVRVATVARDGLDIHLCIEPGIGREGFRICDAPDGGIRIIGDDERGLFYGIGKFLRESHFGDGAFAPGKWRGTSIPTCAIRGVYLATHCHNYYESAPTEQIVRYLEDLALWGLNTVISHFPTHQFEDLNDPAARRSIDQTRAVMNAAKRLGLRVGLIEAPNCAFKSAPARFSYEPFPDDLKRRGNEGTLLCPSNPEARDYLHRMWESVMGEFQDIGLDYLVSWPYDEGGCGCESCWPWGYKGFISISEDLCRIFREMHPNGVFVLSTWVFDTPPAGEWEGLSRVLAEDADWIDCIMADADEGFPRYPLEHPLPGNRPLLNFPEISMWGMVPWGGYGANPLPGRCQELWDQTSGRLAGGFLYSEGIYEDINKTIFLQMYWNKERSAQDILKEYVASQFSTEVADDVLEAIRILESNHHRDRINKDSLRACELLEHADALLPPAVRDSWRWRVLLLRAQIDRELYRSSGRYSGSALAKAFNDLTEIYHAQRAAGCVRPPVISRT